MVSRQFQQWQASGRRWQLARPIMELNNWAHDHDVRVKGTIGNDAHLEKDDPEDHTPFSVTAWPVRLPGYYVCAIDLDNVRGLGWAIERQARAGLLPWLKYMNHSGRHVDFRTGAVSGSADDHVHLSVRSDWVDRSIGLFDPWSEEDEVKPEDIKAIAEAVVRADIDYSDKAAQSFGGGVFTTMQRLADVQGRVTALEKKLEHRLSALEGAVKDLAVAKAPATPAAELAEVLARLDRAAKAWAGGD